MTFLASFLPFHNLLPPWHLHKDTSLHRRIVTGLSFVLFLLVANVATVIVDFNDRVAPITLGVTHVVALDFSKSGLSDPQAFEALAAADRRDRLGLLKVAPDLRDGSQAMVYVAVSEATSRPQRVTFFGDEPEASTRGPMSLANSVATGSYLVTGRTADVGAFETWLTQQGITSSIDSMSVGSILATQLVQGAFLLPLVATVLLIAALALYWLSVKARGRAIRTLAGVAPRRIQIEDATGFVVQVLGGALPFFALACAYVGIRHGTPFIGPYAQLLGAIMVLLCVIAAGSVVFWGFLSRPTVDSLARRSSPLARLGASSNVLRVTTFILVVSTISPAVNGFGETQRRAIELAQWKQLADHVALAFYNTPDEFFERNADPFEAMVSDAQHANRLAYSYAWVDPEYGFTRPVALVNSTWLQLMTPPNGLTSGLTEASWSELSIAERSLLDETLKLWVQDPERPRAGITLKRWTGADRLPLAKGGSGQTLSFVARPLLLVVDDPGRTLDGEQLLSHASTSNVLFQGLGATTTQLNAAGLGKSIRPVYAAEEGLVAAKYAALTAWLNGIAVAAIFVALVTALAIAAIIAAVLGARRDFLLRLSGRSWAQVVRWRVLTEMLVALAICVVVGQLQAAPRWEAIGLVFLATAACAAAAHLLAVRWCFTRVRSRTL